MKRLLLASIVLILSLSCWHSKDYHVDLLTPEKALKTYNEAIRTSDFEYQKKTVVSWIEPIAKERFDRVKPILQGNQTGNLFIEVVNEAEFNKKKDSVYQRKIGIGTAEKKEVPRTRAWKRHERHLEVYRGRGRQET